MDEEGARGVSAGRGRAAESGAVMDAKDFKVLHSHLMYRLLRHSLDLDVARR